MKKLFIPPVFVLISLILIIGFCFFLSEYNIIPFPFNFAGILIALPGFALMGKSRDLFKKRQTTLFIEKSASLVTEGVFSKTRNPMYIGMTLLLFGISICFMNIFSMIVPFVFIITIRFTFVPIEEKMMLETFGEEYLDYKAKVRRWF
jgi:protein-S-isoprenylcysteine O-methyltransferase Ste14